VINDPCVQFASPTPQALARSLEAIVTMPEFAAYSRAAAQSQHDARWESAGETVDMALRNALRVSRDRRQW